MQTKEKAPNRPAGAPTNGYSNHLNQQYQTYQPPAIAGGVIGKAKKLTRREIEKMIAPEKNKGECRHWNVDLIFATFLSGDELICAKCGGRFTLGVLRNILFRKFSEARAEQESDRFEYKEMLQKSIYKEMLLRALRTILQDRSKAYWATEKLSVEMDAQELAWRYESYSRGRDKIKSSHLRSCSWRANTEAIMTTRHFEPAPRSSLSV